MAKKGSRLVLLRPAPSLRVFSPGLIWTISRHCSQNAADRRCYSMPWWNIATPCSQASRWPGTRRVPVHTAGHAFRDQLLVPEDETRWRVATMWATTIPARGRGSSAPSSSTASMPLAELDVNDETAPIGTPPGRGNTLPDYPQHADRMSGHPAVQQVLRNPYFDGLGIPSLARA